MERINPLSDLAEVVRDGERGGSVRRGEGRGGGGGEDKVAGSATRKGGRLGSKGGVPTGRGGSGWCRCRW